MRTVAGRSAACGNLTRSSSSQAVRNVKVGRICLVPGPVVLKSSSRKQLHCRAAPAESQAAAVKGKTEFDLQERMEFLRKDLDHLFDDVGIDPSAYEDVVDFRDPITRHTSIGGYIANIAFLKRAFDPAFTLHDMRVDDRYPAAITTRWTMAMRFTPAAALPSRKYWNPTITFTGTSTYVFNPDSGRICTHIDTWDSIANQEFFSLEGFADFFKQLLSFHATPALETPQYTVLRRARDYEVRRYAPFVVAQTDMEAAAGLNKDVLRAGQVRVNPAGPGMRAFNALARYIFGGNAAGAKMAMTTPVFTDTTGAMQFVIGPSALKAMPSLPAPASPAVALAERPGGVVAARVFGGSPGEEEVQRQAAALRASLRRDGLAWEGGEGQGGAGAEAEGGYTLARYNDPGTPPPFRRNEVLVPLAGFELWG